MYGFLNENFKQSFTSLVSNCKCFQRFLQQNRSRRTAESRSLMARNIGAAPPDVAQNCCLSKSNFVIPEIRFFHHRDSKENIEMNLNFDSTSIIRAGSDLTLNSNSPSENVETTCV